MAIADCTAFLHGKIVTGNSKAFDDLGMMDAEELRVLLLNCNFSRHDTKIAISDCVNLGVLDLYYKIKCPSCGGHSFILEDDPIDKSKASEIINTGYCCRHCNDFVQASLPLTHLYAVSQKYIGSFEDFKSSDELPIKRWFSKFLNFIGGGDGR